MLAEARLGVVAGVLAAFGAIISEVGAVMMVGGNLEGETRVLTTEQLRALTGRVFSAERASDRLWQDYLRAYLNSIGGFVTGLAPGGERVDRLALVGTHTGYWRDYAPRVRLPMYVAWHLAMPAVTRVLGYFPGRRFGLPEDLPAGVARDWARRRRPDPWWYLKRDDGSPDEARIADVVGRLDAFRADALVVSVADDPFATAEATARMAALFRHCRIDERRVDPRGLDLPAVGHFGFFRSRMREALWPIVGDFLAADRP